MQTNSDKINCRQGNVLDGVDRQAKFTVLSICEKAIGIVRGMTGTKQGHGVYQFDLVVQKRRDLQNLLIEVKIGDRRL